MTAELSELSAKEALEKMVEQQFNPLFIAGMKEVIYRQATLFPDHPPVIHFYIGRGGRVQCCLEEQSREFYRELVREDV